MATKDLHKQLERSRAIFLRLIDSLPTAERDMHLSRHVKDVQDAIDRIVGTANVTPRRRRNSSPNPFLTALAPAPAPTAAAKVSSPMPPPSVPSLAIPMPAEPVESPPADTIPSSHPIDEAIQRAEISTVPNAVRFILAKRSHGLNTRQIIEAVKAILPGTYDQHVSSALFTMLNRGELAREGFHKNYRYILVPNFGDRLRPPGGETH